MSRKESIIDREIRLQMEREKELQIDRLRIEEETKQLKPSSPRISPPASLTNGASGSVASAKSSKSNGANVKVGPLHLQTKCN